MRIMNFHTRAYHEALIITYTHLDSSYHYLLENNIIVETTFKMAILATTCLKTNVSEYLRRCFMSLYFSDNLSY